MLKAWGPRTRQLGEGPIGSTFTGPEAVSWGLVGLVLLVNLAGALPLAMEWKKLRRKYRDLCSQETT